MCRSFTLPPLGRMRVRLHRGSVSEEGSMAHIAGWPEERQMWGLGQREAGPSIQLATAQLLWVHCREAAA